MKLTESEEIYPLDKNLIQSSQTHEEKHSQEQNQEDYLLNPSISETPFSTQSTLTIYETKMLETYTTLINILSLNQESLNTMEHTETHPLFSVESLNKEVMQNWQRTKKAGDMLREMYKKAKNVKIGIDKWIKDQVGKDNIHMISGKDMGFVVNEIEKDLKS